MKVNISDMQPHVWHVIPGESMLVMCVPGGWIYRDHSGDREVSLVFVPRTPLSASEINDEWDFNMETL